VYNSTEQCDDLLSKGSGNGGIAAAFDEVPYTRLFLSRYCSKYAMIDPTFKTDGFGFVSSFTPLHFSLCIVSAKFVNPDKDWPAALCCDFQAFPKGSPLVPDVSRAVLNMTEGDKMKEIENDWFGKRSNCPDSSTSVTSNSLSLKSFWGLFLIAGVASLLALIIFMFMFVYKERKMLRPLNSRISIRRKVGNFFRIFIQRDLKSHTFRKSELNDRNGTSLPSMGPLAYSVQTTYFPGDGDQSSTKFVDSSPDCQTSQEVVINIDQLTNPNQERLAAFEVEHDHN
jgi:ionotropic glutamate receptor